MRKLLWMAGGLALAGCTPEPRATAEVVDTNGQKVGTVTVVQRAHSVQIDVDVTGLTPGEHGIHLHEVGRCETPDFTSAGAHFNPLDRTHGIRSPRGPHAGDMHNITADASGRAQLSFNTAMVTLSEGESSLLDADGTALVIHADPDDNQTEPAGNSGARVACGVLVREE
jgi:Cu-Zn family superoxide dismutase